MNGHLSTRHVVMCETRTAWSVRRHTYTSYPLDISHPPTHPPSQAVHVIYQSCSIQLQLPAHSHSLPTPSRPPRLIPPRPIPHPPFPPPPTHYVYATTTHHPPPHPPKFLASVLSCPGNIMPRSCRQAAWIHWQTRNAIAMITSHPASFLLFCKLR